MPNNIYQGATMVDYMNILDNIMEKWLGPVELNRPDDSSAPYRMMALLLDDPWTETTQFNPKNNGYEYVRNYIVDIANPEIQRKLNMLNGPYFNTVMKILELRMLDEDNERNNNRTKNSSRTLV